MNATGGQLVVVTGPPGAGKTTVATVLASTFDLSALVSGDAFFAFVDRGFVSPWLPEAHRQNDIVIQAAAAAAGQLATGGYTVIYDGVVGPWFLPAFTAATGLERLHYLVLLPSEECCVHRVRTRLGHGFTDIAATRHMYREFSNVQIDPRHVLTDPGHEPDATAARIQQLLADDVFAHPARRG
ncbi:MAG: AAA family ATPase [Pseudonocardiaceae bacterium]